MTTRSMSDLEYGCLVALVNGYGAERIIECVQDIAAYRVAIEAEDDATEEAAS